MAAPSVVTLLGRLGGVFATFGPSTQDSGNERRGMRSASRVLRDPALACPAPDVHGACLLFVKPAGDPARDVFPPHGERVRLLRRSTRLICRAHPVLAELCGMLEADRGPLLELASRPGAHGAEGARGRFAHRSARGGVQPRTSRGTSVRGERALGARRPGGRVRRATATEPADRFPGPMAMYGALCQVEEGTR